MDLSELRARYLSGALHLRDLKPDPIEQFESWFLEAQETETSEPNAMTLATADASGRPSARIVLLKAVSEAGFVFYSNYTSRKGRELKANPQAALVFYWPVLTRQVRVEGTVRKLSREDSERYFKSRPLGHRLSAWASRQSAPVRYEALLEALRELEVTYAGGDVPLPPDWGGYLVVPEALEFWQGRANRLHDRFLYCREAAVWTITRLSP